MGVQVLWSDHDEELTRVGIRDGALMADIDLWDEVNGDLSRVNSSSAAACALSCEQDDSCRAWTFTELPSGGICRFKEQAHRSLLVVGGSPGCFLPSHGNWSGAAWTSGFKQQKGVRFVQLYVERRKSWIHNASCGNLSDCGYGRFGYAQTLSNAPSESQSHPNPFPISSQSTRRPASPRQSHRKPAGRRAPHPA